MINGEHVKSNEGKGLIMSNETKTQANNEVASIDWLECPFCGSAFNESNIKKHYIGGLYESYSCGWCGMQTPKEKAGTLKHWWNQRLSA